MNKIETDRNWQETDKLNGEVLKDGESLILRWPDGTMTAETIHVRKGGYNITEQGGPINGTRIPTSLAYVIRQINGTRAEVRIAGLEAERNSAPKEAQG